MACHVTFITDDGRSFDLGRFNEGKKTDTQVALVAAKKYHNLVKRLDLPGHKFVVEREGGRVEIPLAQLKAAL